MAMRSKAARYEQARKQRLEENKQRIKDLGIRELSESLSKASNSATAVSKQRQPKPRAKADTLSEEFQPRRSSRSRTPVVSYVDDFQADLDLSTKRRGRSSSSGLNSSWTNYVARPLHEIVFATDDERECAFNAARRFEKTLPTCHPTFVKSMTRSQVYSCFWLGIPAPFCKQYLPKGNSDLILEHENGSTYETKYIAKSTGLSGGWRGFALKHKINDGDALVFQLVKPEKLKVYTIRVSTAGKEPNADAKNARAAEKEVAPPPQKRQKVKEDKKPEEEKDEVATNEEEESQPKARRGSGRRTVAKNRMKGNGPVVKPQKDQQDPIPDQGHGKKSDDEKDKGAADGGDEDHQIEARGRNSGRRKRAKVADDEPKEVVLALQAEDKKQGLVADGKDEKKTVGEEKSKVKVVKPRKKPEPRLFRRKVFNDGPW